MNYEIWIEKVKLCLYDIGKNEAIDKYGLSLRISFENLISPEETALMFNNATLPEPPKQ